MNIRNPRWVDSTKTRINCEIEHPDFGWIPFTADPNDSATAEVHTRLAAGEAGAIAAAVVIQPSPEELAHYTNQVRDRIEQAGFTYQGQRFDSNQASAIRINIAATAAMNALVVNKAFTKNWKNAANTTVTLDAMKMVELLEALMTHGEACHTTANQIKKEIVNGTITTKEAIDAYDWPNQFQY